jgi:hypothetical protein
MTCNPVHSFSFFTYALCCESINFFVDGAQQWHIHHEYFAKQLVGECKARVAGNYHFAVKSDSPFLAH